MRSTPRKSEPIGYDVIPKVPYVDPTGMWDNYTPLGPEFRYEFHGDHVDTDLRVFEVWSLFENVIDRFAEGLPPKQGVLCFVLDSNDVAVLGFDTTPEACRALGPYGRWFGVEASFKALEQVHDPMEVAIWETMAREHDD